ncbi:hypothetical protein TI03_05270, partial [Achromatium sp. WMS1]
MQTIAQSATPMASDSFQKSFKAYAQWRIQLADTVKEYRAWLESQKLSTSNLEVQIDNTLTFLENDRLTIAVVAEVSRGKTELINAIFFADYGRRLLPSAAGRTTMCPTELLWDKKRNTSYVRLLPIETRQQNLSLNDFKKQENDSYWIESPLNTNSPDQIEATLREIIKTKQVTDIISISAVGSLREHLQPGMFVLVDQFVDRTFARTKS